MARKKKKKKIRYQTSPLYHLGDATRTETKSGGTTTVYPQMRPEE